jgi:chemotaxis-related protein WspD
MTPSITSAAPSSPCWKISGVWGNRTCHELLVQVHCRNCPTLEVAAARVLDEAFAPPDLARQTALYADPKPANRDSVSLVIFRIGPEWFALGSAHWREVTSSRRPHSLPHRRDAALLGIVNIRGRLIPYVCLHTMLKLPRDANRGTASRVAVVDSPAGPWAFLADEFAGVFACNPETHRAAPATRGASTCIRGIFEWNQTTVAWIEEHRLWAQIEAVVI